MTLTHVLIYLRYGECRTPFLLEYVQAYISILVYVWMEYFGFEGNLLSVLEKRVDFLS